MTASLMLSRLLGFAACFLAIISPLRAFDNELTGKVVAGYQGWFAAEGDGTGLGWFHYGFRPGHCTFDMWPDMSEFTAEEQFKTPLSYADGTPATVFSSANEKTVERHFQWMKDYGIDGAALQRFGSNLRSEKMLAWRDLILKHCRKAASVNGRLWFVMYDLSGMRDEDLMAVVAMDWLRLIESDDFRKDPTYMRHNGKPLVAIWGVGFNDHRLYGMEACKQLIDFLKNDQTAGGNSVMLGVPYHWRKGEGDSLPAEESHPVYEMADVLSPWAVGRYRGSNQAGELGRIIEPDIEWCKKKNIAYLPVMFPGFSWQNLQASRDRKSPLNEIPREGGEFLWTQAASAIKAGAKMGYIAMFDEIDEGTTIMKVTNNPPAGDIKFATYEGLPSDYYLWLGGEIGKAFKNPRSVGTRMPARPGMKTP